MTKQALHGLANVLQPYMQDRQDGGSNEQVDLDLVMIKKKIRSRGCLFPRIIDALQGQEAVTVMTKSKMLLDQSRGGCATHFPLLVFSASTPDSPATKNLLPSIQRSPT
jgi:hypothetical protein